MKGLIRVFMAGFVLSAIGCSTYGYKTAIGDKQHAATDWHKVKLLFREPSQKYDVIGVVSVAGGAFASAGDMYQKLIKSAAVLGADAVIVTGEGSSAVQMPSTAYTTANATTYGNTTYGSATTTVSPGATLNLPSNKGLAIKFTK